MSEDSIENNSLILNGNNKPETTVERDIPIKSKIWKEVPTVSVEESIRYRWAEFFRSEEVPAEIKALGALSTDLVVQTSRELGLASFQMGLYTGQPMGGEPTIYGMSLYEDRLEIVLSALADYGNFSVEVTALPISELNRVSGNVVLHLSTEKPDVVDALLSADSNPRSFCQAKVDLMRYLAEKVPGSVKKFGDMGSPSNGLAFTADGKTMVAKLYITEIPDTDPVLGEAIQFYNEVELYAKTVGKMTMDELNEMTVEKIEKYLRNMPTWAKRIIIGKHGDLDAGSKSWRIFELLEKFGYKGNEAQQKWAKSRRISQGFGITFSQELRAKILDTIVNGRRPEDKDLTLEEIDEMFKRSYEFTREYRLPKDFSITSAILDKQPLENLPL